MRSPSETIPYVQWSTSGYPSRFHAAARCCSAIAIPTPIANPCPRGPVVASTPGVRPYSGWPGVRLPHCRNRWSSSMGRS